MTMVTFENRFLDALSTLAEAAKEAARKMPEPVQPETTSRHYTQLGAVKRISRANNIIITYLDDQYITPNTRDVLEEIQKALNDLYPSENSS